MLPEGFHLTWRTTTALAVLLLGVPVGFLVRALVLGRLRGLAERSRWRGDDAIVESLRRPLPVWFGLAGAYTAVRLAGLSPDAVGVIQPLLMAGLVISVSFWVADVCVRFLMTWRAGDSVAAPVTGVIINGVRITVLMLGALVLLGSMGISIAPILTTLGVGGLAVALALQDTLANLFAGVHITLAGNIRVGDYVKLENGDEGYIEDIKWRATRIRTLPGNFVLIPNARLAQSVVTNFNLPAQDLAVLVQVGVHYSSDLDRVEQVIGEEARLALAENGVKDFQPFIRYHTLGDSSINLTVILRAREFVDQFLLKHEFIKRLVKRFAREGIVIPFPIRAINFSQEEVRGEVGFASTPDAS